MQLIAKFDLQPHKCELTGVPLILVQFTGVATPSIHAGFRLVDG